MDICTLDLSFISVAKVVPALCDLLRPSGQLVVLIKPQFEAGKARVEPGGVVRCAGLRRPRRLGRGPRHSPARGRRRSSPPQGPGGAP